MLGAKIDSQTSLIQDKFCQLEMREMQNRINTLQQEKTALETSALLQQQTQNLVGHRVTIYVVYGGVIVGIFYESTGN